MSDPASNGLEAAKETAKAVQEVARLGGKVTEAASGGGRWLDTVIGGPIRDTVGLLWGDRVRTARVVAAIADEQRLADVLAGARDRLRVTGSESRRDLPPKLGLALLEAATVEEEPELQVLWSNLLASAVDGDADPVEKSFVSILADLSVNDAEALTDYFSQWPLDGRDKSFRGDGIVYSPGLDGDRYGQIVTRNLFRLGLIEPATNYFDNYDPPQHDYEYGEYGGATERVAIPGTLNSAVFTELGTAFCKAVGLLDRLAREDSKGTLVE